jgi:hypothetical protein
VITFGGEDDSVHRLAEHADGRWVGAMILAVILFWTGVGYLVWRHFA